MELLRCSLSITHQRAVNITERQREWIDEDGESGSGTVKGYFPTWWNQIGNLVLLSNACKPHALPSPVQENTARLTGLAVVFAVSLARIKPPTAPLVLLYTHAPLCSSGCLPKSLSPLFISINPLNVPFPPRFLSRAPPLACCCPAESFIHFARKRERFVCVLCVCVWVWRANEAERQKNPWMCYLLLALSAQCSSPHPFSRQFKVRYYTLYFSPALPESPYPNGSKTLQ